MKPRTVKKGFLGVMGLFLLSALTPALIPFAVDKNGDLTQIGYAAGALFWLGLLLGIAAYLFLARKAKPLTEQAGKRKLPSVICFFSNTPAIAADAVMIVSIAATIYCALHIEVNDFLAITALVFALAGVYAHFLFNGNVYFYIWNSRNRQRKRQTKERQQYTASYRIDPRNRSRSRRTDLVLCDQKKERRKQIKSLKLIKIRQK